MICNGLVNMQSLGLGGGFLMTIYDKAAGRAYVLNARDRAPLLANATMYAGKPEHVSSIGKSSSMFLYFPSLTCRSIIRDLSFLKRCLQTSLTFNIEN